MSMASECLPVWQHISEPVSDIQLYPYLVRLAIVANKQAKASTAKKEEDTSNSLYGPGKDAMVVSKLPKGTIKTLMTYFKQLALDKQSEPVDPALKRTYLAFYAQLLDMKSKQSGELEDVGQTAELLIVRFIACVTKVSGSPSVESQGTQFVSLLRGIVRKNGGSATLDSQLSARQQKFHEKVAPKSPKKPVKILDVDTIAEQVARIMLVSPTLFERDLSQETDITLENCASVIQQLKEALNIKQHPVYQFTDFETEADWNSFAESELSQLDEMMQYLPQVTPVHSTPDLVPDNVRAYFTVFIQRCIEADMKAPTLFGQKTLYLIRFVSQFWRVSARTYVTCLLHAVNRLFNSDLLNAPHIVEAYDYVDHLLSEASGPWALPDKLLAKEATSDLRDIVIKKLQAALTQLFAPKPVKLGPYIQILEEAIPSVSSTWDDDKVIDDVHLQQLLVTLTDASEQEYVRLVSQLPRDSNLDIQHILEYVQAIIRVSQKLQNKFRVPLFNKIPIAKVVCAQHLKLLFSDFVPIWRFCMKQYESKNEEPPFDVMTSLHDELVVLHDLHSQLKLDDGNTFNPESLLFPYFKNWAVESAKLSLEWVKPVLEQDDNLPIDKESNLMHSVAVKDLFSSFYSLISLVEKQRWQDPYYSAKLLTIVVDGISNAICTWANEIFLLFLQEVKPRKNKIRLKAKEQDEQWLAYAKEATVQATAAVMAARQNQPQNFDFKQQSGVRLNNITKAYELLHQMESQINSDSISKQIQKFEGTTKPKGLSYLFTLTIASATDMNQNDGGFYVTVVDQDTRKQLGKTSTAYVNTRPPTWNEPIELEVSMNRPKLLKATLWSDNQNGDHELCGRATIRLDPSQFSRKEYGTQLKWIDLESGKGKLQVLLAMDLLQDDVRFHFGKALRFLKRSHDSMIEAIVKQFSGYIYALLSRQTLREVTGTGSLATSVQSSVNQLQKSFNMWLGKANHREKQEQVLAKEVAVDDCLEPLYDYLNKNFATLAEILTPELRIEVLSSTWDVVLEALELLIIPPLDFRRTSRTQLSSIEMETVFLWLSSLRDFFHSDGAGPSLERLQSQSYQQIMAIPVYYDLPSTQLKIESEKVVKSSLRAIAGSQELLARQRTVMAHRNKSIIEHQALQLNNARRTTPQLDDVILRILRLRGEYSFIEQHLKFRERLLQRELTEKALQGSVF